MREAMGGSLMLYLVLPIIVLFICFIAFIMKYASAYRAANYAITQIENCQGQMDKCNGVTMVTITEDIKGLYKYITKNNKPIETCYIPNGKNNNAYVYRVKLPVTFEFPAIGEVTPWSVIAETKTMVNVPPSSVAQFPKCKP